MGPGNSDSPALVYDSGQKLPPVNQGDIKLFSPPKLGVLLLDGCAEDHLRGPINVAGIMAYEDRNPQGPQILNNLVLSDIRARDRNALSHHHPG